MPRKEDQVCAPKITQVVDADEFADAMAFVQHALPVRIMTILVSTSQMPTRHP
jgi:hypothetical protein